MKKIRISTKILVIGAVIIISIIGIDAATIKLGNDPSGNVVYGISGGHSVLVNSNGNVWHIGNETDISDEIQDAIDDLGKRDGFVRIGTGTFYVNDTINMTEGLTLEGVSGGRNQWGPYLKFYTDGKDCIRFNMRDYKAADGHGTKVIIRNIRTTAYQDTYAIINITGGIGHIIENVETEKAGTPEIKYSVFCNGTYNTLIENCDIKTGDIAGIRLQDRNTPVWYSVMCFIERNFIDECTTGIWVNAGITHTKIFSNDFGESITHSRINLSTETRGGRTNHVSIIDNRFEENDNTYGIVLSECHNTLIERNHFHMRRNFHWLNNAVSYNITNTVIRGNTFTCRNAPNLSVHLGGDNTIFENNNCPNITVDFGNNIIIEGNTLYPRDQLGYRQLDQVDKFHYNISLNGSRTRNVTVRDNYICGVIDNYADDTHIWNNWFYGGNRLDINFPSNPIEGTMYYVQGNSSVAVFDGTDWHYLVPS